MGRPLPEGVHVAYPLAAGYAPEERGTEVVSLGAIGTQ